MNDADYVVIHMNATTPNEVCATVIQAISPKAHIVLGQPVKMVKGTGREVLDTLNEAGLVEAAWFVDQLLNTLKVKPPWLQG